MTYPLIILCALGGFCLATFIHVRKKTDRPIVCPIGHSCDPVVRSRHSRFVGMPVELGGALYYLFILVSYSLFFMYPAMKTEGVGIFFLVISGLAVLFSLYLTTVQAFILKEWCTWCLISAALCAVIFFSALSSSGVTVTMISSY